MVEIKQRRANRNNYGLSRNVKNIKYIVIHYTANDGDRAKNNADYFANKIIKASAHYFVDDDYVYQSVPDNYVAYSVGGSKYSNCSTTGGGKYYKICTNSNSISIELCDVVKNGQIYPSTKTIANAIELTKSLMKKYNIPASNVVRHFDVTGKNCPSYWCSSATKNKLWLNEFKNKLTTTTKSKPTTTSTTTSTNKSKTTTISTNKANIINFQTWLNKYFNSNLKVDGVWGTNSKKATIKAWQSSCNKLYKTNLKVDGIWGDNSKKASSKVIIKLNNNNRFVYILQGVLNAYGYTCSFNGKVDTNTIKQVKQFQKDKKLKTDGVVGSSTWNKLFS